MKKSILALLIAGTLVGGTTASFAADKTPMAKPTAAAEGTAKHEAAESSSTQKQESKSAKPMATAKTKTKAAKKPAKK